MTLTWNNGNDWAGSATDPRRAGPLTAFGKQVVHRMNELGMLVDVSHVSDSTFWDVIATSTRPVIASHSACRTLAHHPRNLTDEQLRALARTGGLIGINFYPVFLDDRFRHEYEALRQRLRPQTDSIRARYRGRPGASAFAVDKFIGEQVAGLDVPGIDRLVDHIEHAVRVAGIDHVGLGSDFDGISVLPVPMKDAASLPLLVAALTGRGYSDGDVRKILGENFLRVLSAAR
jgi:membrane dipeptidase